LIHHPDGYFASFSACTLGKIPVLGGHLIFKNNLWFFLKIKIKLEIEKPVFLKILRIKKPLVLVF
jgi:hypothetical protein